jgi:pimeloyl-ACP methyl ester carboxylesterase
MSNPISRRLPTALAVVALCSLIIACAESAPQPASVPPAESTRALADAADQTLTRNGVTINYRTIGNGEPILLVHGYGDNLKMWVGLADSLATTHRVIAVDARGFGKSSKPSDAGSYGSAMVEDLVALLDTAGARQAHVVGYSMGAMLAAELALRHPDRVRTATLAAGSFHKDADGMRTMIKPWLEDLESGRRLTRLLKQIVPVLSDSQVKTFSDQLFAEGDSAALVGAMKSFSDLSVDWTRVDSTKIPAVAIVGVDDPLRPHSRDLAARWPAARLVELPATDHMTIIGSPRLLAEIRGLIARAPIDGAAARR